MGVSYAAIVRATIRDIADQLARHADHLRQTEPNERIEEIRNLYDVATVLSSAVREVPQVVVAKIIQRAKCGR